MYYTKLTTTCTDYWQSTTSCQQGLFNNYCSLVGFKGKGSYSPFTDLSCIFKSNCLQKKLLKPLTPFFQDQMKNGFKLISFGQAALKFCLPEATSCLSSLMILLRNDLHWILAHWASKKICLSQTTGQYYFRALLLRVID